MAGTIIPDRGAVLPRDPYGETGERAASAFWASAEKQNGQERPAGTLILAGLFYCLPGDSFPPERAYLPSYHCGQAAMVAPAKARCSLCCTCCELSLQRIPFQIVFFDTEITICTEFSPGMARVRSLSPRLASFPGRLCFADRQARRIFFLQSSGRRS